MKTASRLAHRGLPYLLGLLVAAGLPAARADNLAADIATDFPRLEALFEHFHANPELSMQESMTSERIAAELQAEGYEVTRGIAKTGLVAILGAEPDRDATDTLNTVRREFRERWGLIWLAPLGFENAYELAVPRELARRLGLRTISDLAAAAPGLKAGLGYEFIERDDGLRGLAEVYGLRFAEVVGMQQALKYQAAADRRIDVLDVYTTDGRLLVADLVVLEDRRR